MLAKTRVYKILAFQAIGFLAIIALSWINESFDLPYVLGAEKYIPNWRESVLETIIVLLVAIPTMIITRALVSRLFHLEGFLRVCAWCKKLEHNGEWLPLEEFFAQKFETDTSHGMCPVCNAEMRAKIKRHSVAA